VLGHAASLRDDPAPLQDAADAVEREVRAVLTDHGTPELAVELDVRYAGQSYEVSVPLETPITGAAVDDAVRAFHDRHRQRYGHADPDEPVEIVTLRGRGTVAVPPPALPQEPETNAPLDDAVLGTRPVWFNADGPTETTAYAREALHHGHAFEGPAVLHQYDTTIVVPPHWQARVDGRQNVWIER
jgi:N-methylhydantoinase A